jgi:3-hydroxyacyl-[acyl-carrier-protein] dehydratase
MVPSERPIADGLVMVVRSLRRAEDILLSAAGREVMINEPRGLGPWFAEGLPASGAANARAATPPLLFAAAKGRSGMPPVALVDPATIDTSRVLIDREGIRRGNPQRYEMEQLTAIVLIDPDAHLIIGYKDVGPDEFWIRGHMPDYPLMPGVLICEAAAQLSSYYCHHIKLNEVDFIGFGGLEDVRFRGQVRLGDRLVLVSKAIRIHRRQTIFETQGLRPRGSSRPIWSIMAGSSASR